MAFAKLLWPFVTGSAAAAKFLIIHRTAGSIDTSETGCRKPNVATYCRQNSIQWRSGELASYLFWYVQTTTVIWIVRLTLTQTLTLNLLTVTLTLQILLILLTLWICINLEWSRQLRDYGGVVSFSCPGIFTSSSLPLTVFSAAHFSAWCCWAVWRPSSQCWIFL